MTKNQKLESNGHSLDNNNYLNDKNDFNKNFKIHKFRLKTFKIQESYIDRPLLDKDKKPIYHFLIIFAGYLAFLNVIYYFVNPNEISRELNYIQYVFEHFSVFVILEFVYLGILLIIVHPLTKFYLKLKTKFSSIQNYLDTIFAIFIILLIGSIYSGVFKIILIKNINPILTFAICAEKVRFAMKVHAFIIESKRKLEDNKDAQFATYKQLLYYWFAPTLIYRDEYPRLEKRDYKLMANLIIQFLVTNYVLMIAYTRIFIPTFSVIGNGPIDARLFIQSLAYVFFGAILHAFVEFYMFLHVYLNIFGQIMMFGDRVFYEDWWCCTHPTTHFRKMNIVVHDYIHSYLYLPFVNMFNGDRALASVLSIAISAVVHEYIMMLSLRHINLIQTILFLGLGGLVFFLNRLDGIGSKKLENDKLTMNGVKKQIDYDSLDYTLANLPFLFSFLLGWFF